MTKIHIPGIEKNEKGWFISPADLVYRPISLLHHRKTNHVFYFHTCGKGFEMIEVKKALVCVDLSDYSKMTMEYALSLVSGIVSQLVLLNVINSRDVEAVKFASHYYPGEVNLEHFLKEAKADRQQRIQEMLKHYSIPEQVQVDIVIKQGNPFNEILTTIKEDNIDLVIIGNKGRSNVVGTLLGSIAEKVLRHSPVPVISVRDKAQFGR
jgi:nucleotide-binding universal stress UspA family protein